ncbi:MULTISPECIES: DUF192 domain-containing protein [Rheinheimera]|uniref:DUF192 domain-containing protein n=1 Tax=Rheinheimera marina TaxID=1774958 RepID=A0ABV9JII2_9GAMM
MSRLIVLFALLGITACQAQQIQPESVQFDKEWLQLGTEQIEVELAISPEQRAQGLMHRLNVQTGMLFIGDEVRPMAFWMLNTPSALDLAYIKADWTIEQVIALKPFDQTSRPSAGPVLGALEMPLGWFQAHGIKAGDSIKRCGKTACDKAQD